VEQFLKRNLNTIILENVNTYAQMKDTKVQQKDAQK
jgi:hypothetical protein